MTPPLTLPIETTAGILRGRDCIYMDAVVRDDIGNMVFTGDLNGELVEKQRLLK